MEGLVGGRESRDFADSNMVDISIGRVLLSATVFRSLLLCRVSDFNCGSLLLRADLLSRLTLDGTCPDELAFLTTIRGLTSDISLSTIQAR